MIAEVIRLHQEGKTPVQIGFLVGAPVGEVLALLGELGLA